MKTLITGAYGFLGANLADFFIKERKEDLYLADLKFIKKKNWFSCDFSDLSAVKLLLEEIKPEKIFHLIGSFSNNYDEDYKNNVIATKNIFDGCLELNINPRILILGSSAEYGFVSENDNPISENYPLSPVNIYGLTKTFQTMLMKYYFNVFGIHVLMGRPFNIYGAGISNRLVVGRIYEEIKKYKKGEINKIILGNLDSKRDYLPVEKAIEYIAYIMEYGLIGEIYNIGKGESVKISALVERILNANGLDFSIVEQNLSSKPKKGLDVHDIFADISKINAIKTS
jgi:GDP-4-dehydro-6-deoxy-D-mannose reductase